MNDSAWLPTPEWAPTPGGLRHRPDRGLLGADPPDAPGTVVNTPVVGLTTDGRVVSERKTRAQRAALPVSDEIIHELAVRNGICVRPIPLRGTESGGTSRIVPTPCRCTRASVCEPCAKVALSLRIADARAGWHADREPIVTKVITEEQQALIAARTDLLAVCRVARKEGDERADELIAELVELDAECRAHGITGLEALDPAPRRKIARSTRRRPGDAPLPRRKVDKRTVGKTFGPGYRPSTFLTLTCGSYGAVDADGAPRHPESYDYRRAARDMIVWSAAHDRFVTELRRAVGWSVQHFTTTEPQRRAAPHSHSLIRGAVPREIVRQLVAALVYRQYWPQYDEQTHTVDEIVWNEQLHRYVDRDGLVLPSFKDAAELVPDEQPSHEFRFGAQVDVKGMIAGTPEADKKIRYVTKYVTKDVAEVLGNPDSDRLARHYDRLHQELVKTPCSPSCKLWCLYGVTPTGATAKTKPGKCRSRAHRREHVGVVGRRCLVSRKWSGKDLRDHRADRVEFVRQVLGTDVADTRSGWRWTMPDRTDPDIPSRSRLVAAAVVERLAWRRDYEAALAATDSPVVGCTGE